MIEINPQFLHTESGELVVLTRAEFDALVSHADPDAEDEADAALFAGRMIDLAAGRDKPLPAAVTALMLKGDSLLRALRKWRGRTQADLARSTSLTQGYISEIENGAKPGTVNALSSIAKALSIPDAWIVPAGVTLE